jgi:N-ethylmaleimide reductase
VIAAGHADLVAFSVPFLANPDLVERLRRDAPLNKPDPATFYGIGPNWYTTRCSPTPSPPDLPPETQRI